jgi:NAD(P)-dependent dehydrogenase (short-subunit alcohol dehydrogenase family)
MGRLEGRVALITGGGRGIGRAIARGYAREGADVAIVYVRHPEAAEAVVDELRALGRRSAAYPADTADAQAVRAVVDRVVEDFGRVDVLVNNAGVLVRSPFLEMAPEDLDRVVAVNLRGPFHCAQAVARHMVRQGGGVIINITSEAARRTLPDLSAYGATKAGVVHLTRCMAVELAPYGIRVNSIAPGMTETDINRERLKDPAFRESRLQRIPLRRIADPEDLVEVAILLASDGSRMMTGADVAVDGGSTIS